MLQIYYHSNYINKLISLILNKLNALKYGNNNYENLVFYEMSD